MYRVNLYNWTGCYINLVVHTISCWFASSTDPVHNVGLMCDVMSKLCHEGRIIAVDKEGKETFRVVFLKRQYELLYTLFLRPGIEGESCHSLLFLTGNLHCLLQILIQGDANWKLVYTYLTTIPRFQSRLSFQDNLSFKTRFLTKIKTKISHSLALGRKQIGWDDLSILRLTFFYNPFKRRKSDFMKKS